MAEINEDFLSPTDPRVAEVMAAARVLFEKTHDVVQRAGVVPPEGVDPESYAKVVAVSQAVVGIFNTSGAGVGDNVRGAAIALGAAFVQSGAPEALFSLLAGQIGVTVQQASNHPILRPSQGRG